MVFVDGKLEGLIGVVEEVSLSFKIRISDYKRVIGKADTSVCGELFFGENTFIAFDRSIIPYEKLFQVPCQAPLADAVLNRVGCFHQKNGRAHRCCR